MLRTRQFLNPFDLEMCFAPQRRALFWHLNCQKWSEHGVLCTFSLAHELRAAAACNFSSIIWPDFSAPAALASLLFNPLEPQIIGKTQCFATFVSFRAPGSSFFWLSLLWSSFFFSSLLFSDSSHLCFSSVHVVGSLTSNLPSNIHILIFIKSSSTYIYIYIYISHMSINQEIVAWTPHRTHRRARFASCDSLAEVQVCDLQVDGLGIKRDIVGNLWQTMKRKHYFLEVS